MGNIETIDRMLLNLFGRPIFYILRDGVPRPATFGEIAKRGAASEPLLVAHVAGYRISTVFLGMDLAAGFADPPPDVPPLLFETMLFPSNRCWRYATVAEAVAGHSAAIEWARKHPATAEI